jgi:ATP-binding cassette, subfamily B, bacterial
MTEKNHRDRRKLILISQNIRQSLSVFRYGGRALQLVWTTSQSLTVALALLALVGGLLPGAIALVGKLIVDSVILANRSGLQLDRQTALNYVYLEAIAIVILAAAQKGLVVCQSLLRVLLAQRVNELILEKALTLDLTHFEDSEFYDKMSQARSQASSRPLSLITRTFGLCQSAVCCGNSLVGRC